MEHIHKPVAPFHPEIMNNVGRDGKETISGKLKAVSGNGDLAPQAPQQHNFIAVRIVQWRVIRAFKVAPIEIVRNIIVVVGHLHQGIRRAVSKANPLHGSSPFCVG